MDIISIWFSLHSTLTNPPDYGDYLSEIDPETDLFGCELALLKELNDVEKHRWALLGTAAGWTQIAAMGLSWCKNATLSEVLLAWREAGKVDINTPHAVAAAQLTYLGILPAPQVSKIISEGEDIGGAWVIIQALNYNKVEIEFDRPKEEITALNPIILELMETNRHL